MKNALTFILALACYWSCKADAFAQVHIIDQVLEGYSECFSFAIANNMVYKSDESIEFVCHGDVSKRLFDIMTQKRVVSEHTTLNTKGEFIIFHPGSPDLDECWHQIANAEGFGVSNYGCELFFYVGPFLNK